MSKRGFFAALSLKHQQRRVVLWRSAIFRPRMLELPTTESWRTGTNNPQRKQQATNLGIKMLPLIIGLGKDETSLEQGER